MLKLILSASGMQDSEHQGRIRNYHGQRRFDEKAIAEISRSIFEEAFLLKTDGRPYCWIRARAQARLRARTRKNRGRIRIPGSS